MFTGIIQQKAMITNILSEQEILTLEIKLNKKIKDIKIGDSISINGVCLTVANIKNNKLLFNLVPETIKKTNLSLLSIGQEVNLETALCFGDPVNGHIVQGHIDSTCTVLLIKSHKYYKIIYFSLPEITKNLLVPKGSVALDGVSLTIAEMTKESFSIAYIPHTLIETISQDYKINQQVNLEIDILAKQLKQLTKVYL